MAEILSPGIFVEEIPSGQNIVQLVSTSNLGAVGFVPRGPTDTATFVSSFEEFQRVFGADTRNSLLWKSVAAFYANGGKRAYIVRVVPSDAVLANGQIQSNTYNQLIETNTAGTEVTFEKDAANSLLKDNDGHATLVPGAFSVQFRGAGSPVSAEQAFKRDGITPLMGNTVATKFEGRITPYAHKVVGSGDAAVMYMARVAGEAGQALQVAHVIPSVITPDISITVTGNLVTITAAADGSPVISDSTAAEMAAAVLAHPQASVLLYAYAVVPAGTTKVAAQTAVNLDGISDIIDPFDVVVSGSSNNVTLGWTSGGSKTLVLLGSEAGPVVTATSADGTASFDRRSGIFSLTTALVPTATPITVAYTPATPIYTVTSDTSVTTAGKVLLSGAALSAGGITDNYLNVTDGSYKITLSASTKFHKGGKMLATYKINAWSIVPISKGVWANDLRLDIFGNDNWYAAATNQYDRFDANVLMLDSLGNYVVMETYEELDFRDPTSAVFFADVINELSDYVNITTPAGDEAPGELQGSGWIGSNMAFNAHSRAIGGGDEDAAGKVFSITVENAPIGRRSVVVSFTSSVDGLPYTITDDGNGYMVGAIDMSGTNEVDYAAGTVSFKTANPVKVGTLVTITYVKSAIETTHAEYVGDTSKYYTFSVTTPAAHTYNFFTAGSDGTFTTSTFTRSQFTDPGLSGSYAGVYALNRVDEMMQVIVPDFAGDIVVSGDLLDYAESRAGQPSGGDRFIILAVPRGCSSSDAIEWIRFTFGRLSKFAALYWPWVKVADPLLNGRNLTMPPLGHIAGVYARTDVTKNVGKSPAGTVDGQLRYLTGLEMIPSQGDRDLVYPAKINPLISTPYTGMAVWGARTIAAESEWRYINARRLFMFLEKSIFQSTHWIVFENNGPALWNRIKGQLNSFLTNLFNEGYFAGNSPSQAFYVTCDSSNNPQSVVDAGQVIVDVGVAPNKPAEFVRFRFQQKSL